MGLKSIHKSDFERLKSLGIYNPRLNKVYIKNISEITDEFIEIVNKEVIGYNK